MKFGVISATPDTTVDNHMLKLRQKLETDPSHPLHFLTVHGGAISSCLRRRATYKAALNNFARLSMSAVPASPITK